MTENGTHNKKGWLSNAPVGSILAARKHALKPLQVTIE